MKIKKNIKKEVITLNIDFQALDDSYVINSSYWRKEYIELGSLLNKLLLENPDDFYKIVFNTRITLYNTGLTINDVEFDDVNLVKGDNIYIFPGTNLPRYKIREKGKEVGFQIKREIDNSNVVIFDRAYFSKSLKWNRSTMTRINYNTLKTHLENHNLSVDLLFSEEEINFLEENPLDYLYVSNLIRNTNNFDSIFSEFLYDYSEYNRLDEDSNVKELYNILENLTNSQKKIFNGSDVLNELNSSVVLNDKNYNRLRQMLSSDKDSVTLAMEMLCNINLEKSAFLVLKILKDFNNIMYNNISYNHANFKSFRSVLDTFFKNSRKDDLFVSTIREDDIIRLMGNVKLLTHAHVAELIESMKKLIDHSNPYRMYFSIKNVIATDNLKRLLEDSSENIARLKENEIGEETEEENVEN